MSKILQIGLLLAVLANPLKVLPQAEAQAETKIVPIEINTSLSTAIDTGIKKLDFHTEFTIPAHQRLADIEQQKLAKEAEGITQALAQNGFKTDFAHLYLKAQKLTGTPWQLIAAVHKVETGQRGDTTVASYAGAQGPMQFMPATWRAYAKDADGDGATNIHDVDDAILTGANYLRAGGAAQGNYQRALFSYNHAQWYVNKVLAIARPLGLK